RLGVMVILAGLFGAFSGLAGTFVSANVNQLPTGPLVVLAATLLFVISLLAAPRRGIISKLLVFAAVRGKVRREDAALRLEGRNK
ncbi:metal ABC transporter permease, partial [Paenibacillus sepulcri]|nr:metal ABC transporter permease [Paenibacillus sepulcri]